MLFAALHESAHGTKRQFARCKAMSGVGGRAEMPVVRSDFSLWTQLGHGGLSQ
jgi:hypothetical protein